jgi:hypothetical protein
VVWFREEVYVDGAAAVVKYNLVFIHRGLCQRDNGRVLVTTTLTDTMNVIGSGGANQ